jgi:hypothetical protein
VSVNDRLGCFDEPGRPNTVKRVGEIAIPRPTYGGLSLVNCYFAHDSSGFPVLLLSGANAFKIAITCSTRANPATEQYYMPCGRRNNNSPDTAAVLRLPSAATVFGTQDVPFSPNASTTVA